MKTPFSMLISAISVSLAFASPSPPVTALAYHPNGKLLAAGTHGEIALIDPAKGEVVTKIAGQANRVTGIAFNKAGDQLVVASGEPGKSGQIRVYEMNGFTAKLRATLEKAHSDIIYALTISPDGKLLASAGYDRTIKLWNTSTFADPKLLQDHSDAIHSLSFHPDGKLLASAAADRAVKIWDIESGKRLYTLSDPTDGVYAAAWSPDGKHLAAAGIDKSLRVWEANAEGGKLAHSVFAHTQPVTRILYSKDGKTLYSIGEGKNIKGWNTATMKEIFVSPDQTETMLAFALSPDQKQLAVGFFDGKLKLMEADTGKTTAEPLPAKPKPPVLQKLTPNAGVRGTTIRVVFEGQNLGQLTEAFGELGDVRVELIAKSQTATRVEADVSIPKSAGQSVVSVSLRSTAFVSNSLPFTIDRYPVIAETGPRDSPRIGLKVNLPATLVGTIGRAGDADFYRFDAGAGREIAVQVLTAGSKLEPIIELTDGNGKLLAESANGLLGYRCKTAGAYALGIRDKDFRGGADFTYRISVGHFPIVTAVHPLSIGRNKPTDVELCGVNLGDRRQILFAARADATPGSKLDIPLPRFAEKPLGQAQIIVGEFQERPVTRDSTSISVPGTATGVIREPNAVHHITFAANKGQRLIVEVEARRLGSPLDSAIEIVDAKNQPVQRATLRCVARTFSTFRDNDSVGSGIRLEYWNELGIDDYLYIGGELVRIKQLPKGPDDDCQFYSVAGQRVGFLDTTPIQHALGSPMYKVSIHPPGSTFPPNGMPVFSIPYRNDDGGPGYGKDSRLFFDPPADGEYRVRIRDARGQGGELFAYRLTVRPPRPDFSVEFSPQKVAVWKGGSVPITVTATRIDGFDGPITVRLVDLPSGFDAPTTTIESGQTTAVLPLYSVPTANLKGAAPFMLSASATLWGTQNVKKADFEGSHAKGIFVKGGSVTLVEPGDIVTTTNLNEVTIKPGQETKLLVTIERRNNFKGRIPIEVRGLPHGVRVLDIGLNGILITERDTEREIVLYAEPWVKPMEHPFIVLAKREGKNTEHGAKSVLLKVQK
jgi:WD domain, G-beta repeat